MLIRRRSSVIVLITLLASAAIPACAKHSSTTSRAGSLDDAMVTTQVKTAFINDTVIGGARIDVDTVKGLVTLSGRVASKE